MNAMTLNGRVYRWRRESVPNQYNPQRPTFGPWLPDQVVVLEGASVLASSAYSLRTADRDTALAAKSLFLDDPGADVRRGDGISLSPGGDAPEFVVNLVPVVDVNPFTSTALVREVPLSGEVG